MAITCNTLAAALIITLFGISGVQTQEYSTQNVTFSCGAKRFCKEMISCEEAVFHFKYCNLKSLARGSSGVPCISSVCRQGHPGWEERLRVPAQHRDDGWLKQEEWLEGRVPIPPDAVQFACAPKKTCRQMRSCEEARFRLKICGHLQLDRDRDGVPCEVVCR